MHFGMQKPHWTGEAGGRDGSAALQKFATAEWTGIATNVNTSHAELSLEIVVRRIAPQDL
jgi:hypothetical protein